MKTDYRSLYGKTHLGAWDLQDKDVTVTITAVEGGELVSVGGKKSKKPVLSLQGTKKKLALGAGTGKVVATMYGKFVEEWVGKRITLYKTTTELAGETVECIRIRPQIPAPKGTKGAAHEPETISTSDTADDHSATLGEGGTT